MTMQALVIKDNSPVTPEQLQQIPLLKMRVLDKSLEQLQAEDFFVFPDIIRDAEDLTRDQMILRTDKQAIWTSNVMGFLGINDERLTIQSRFATGANDYFFRYLLEKVLDMPSIIDLDIDTNREEYLYRLYRFLFPTYLKRAMRKGEYKTYVRNQYNDTNIKGAIDVERHIRSNTPFTGKIAYNQREFSYDNEVTQLIRHTIEFIKKQESGNQILRKVKDEVTAIVASTQNYQYYDRRKIVDKNKKNPIRHAYYHEYRALQRLCLLILQHEKHGMGSGNDHIQGILFDGAWLWEEYLNTLIGKDFYHPMNKSGDGVQQLFTGPGGQFGAIYPDFIGRHPDARVVADAKYKRITGIGGPDYKQILTYMFRFDANKGFFLYPEVDGRDELTFHLNSGTKYEKNVKKRDDIIIAKLGLKIPMDADSYDDFLLKMRTAEREFVTRMI
jgi:5-methylcytosine-specific restriction endonuclease McrBC regulatory subunit McrC